MAVEVSLNQQELTSDSVSFSAYAEPVVSMLRFDRGPISGGTSVAISRSNFDGGSVFRCRFGGAEVVASFVSLHNELHCVTPAGTAGVATVQVSLNGMQFTTASPTFEYLAHATISHVLPSAGPIGGGTSVVVVGAGFAGVAAAARLQKEYGYQVELLEARPNAESDLRGFSCRSGSAWGLGDAGRGLHIEPG